MDEKEIDEWEQYLIKRYDLEDALIFCEPDGSMQVEMYYKKDNAYRIFKVSQISFGGIQRNL